MLQRRFMDEKCEISMPFTGKMVRNEGQVEMSANTGLFWPVQSWVGAHVD